MAVSRMLKTVVAGSLSELEPFMRELQHAAIFHVTALIKKGIDSSESYNHGESSHFSGGDYRGLSEIKEFLDGFRGEESFWIKIFAQPREMKRGNFYAAVESFDPSELIRQGGELKRRIGLLHEERKSLVDLLGRLEPWRGISVNLESAGDSSEAFTAAGIIDNSSLRLIKETPGIDWQILDPGIKKSALLLGCLRSDRETLEHLIQETGFETLDVSLIDGSPAGTYRSGMKRLISIDKELEEAHREGERLLSRYDDLILAIEHLGNIGSLNRAFSLWDTTPYSFFAAGWIMEKDLERLRAITAEFDAVEFDIVEPEPGESPPVALENRRVFAPFQLLTRLYGYPSYGTYDPSAVTSLFFALFFAICMTDAAYGVILAVLSFWGLVKTSWRSDILWIAFWGGIFTVAAGLLTGGIFGDLFRGNDPFINMKSLHDFREFFIWFDPMVEPMSFFRLVLLLGVIHVLTGLAIGLISNISRRRYADALFDNLTWLAIIISLLSMLFASELSVKMALVSTGSPILGKAVILPAGITAASAGALVILFGGRGEKSLFFRFFIGFLRLFVLSGVFSYMGDILSYIRLMALGMVTSGIAAAVNTIAFMMADIPLLGFVLTSLVLAAGHLFNLAIGVLGSFVHTLRLQYVEFYSKFFYGGGVPFEPLSLNSRYVKIID